MKISDALLIVCISAPISALALGNDDHAQHHAPGSTQSTPQNPATEPVIKPATATEQSLAQTQQDAFPDPGSMSMAPHMGGQYYSMIMLDRLEAQHVDADAATALVWDAKVSWGPDFDKINLGSEGEAIAGEIQHARTELFWSHAVLRWWETTVGARYDHGDNSGNEKDRAWAALGMQGMAPCFVNITATVYAGDEGRSALRVAAEYDMRFSDRLLLQPRLELNAYGKDDAANAIGRGISDSEFGLRLRYEIRREIAPYIGVEWANKYSGTADFARAAGERSGEARALAGIRLWY